MVKINKLLVSVLSIMIYSCAPMIHNKDKFIVKVDANINELRTNGYYYTLDSTSKYGTNSIMARILFKEGYFKELGIINPNLDNQYFKKKCSEIQSNALKNLECMIDNYDYFFKIKTNFLNRNSSVWGWGGTQIKGNSIKIQYYYNRFGDYYLIEEEGRIINDHSFIIYSKYDYRNGRKENLNVKYFFKEYFVTKVIDFKPDIHFLI